MENIELKLTLTSDNVRILLQVLQYINGTDREKLLPDYPKLMDVIADRFSEDALKYGHDLLSDAQKNTCARHDPDIALRYVPNEVLTVETLEYWKSDSPDTYGYFLEQLHPECPDCNEPLEYESLTEDFRCCCGSVRSITEVEDLLGDILTKRPEK